MTATTHTHPKPSLNRAVQYGAVLVVALMVISAPLQVLLIAAGAPEGFLLTAFLTLLLTLPVIMLTAVAPAVTVDAQGITLKPTLWKARFIRWEDVQAVKPYPLLPAQETEVNRRAFVGRRNYRPAEGIMLVIPGLPPQYRIAGVFAGESGAPVIALTNRAHREYDTLVKTVLSHTAPEIQAL